MNNTEIETKLSDITTSLLHEKGFISPLDIFMRLGYLDKKDYEAWRHGKVSTIESVIKINLGKINFILRTLHKNCIQGKLKPSWTAYRMWGKRKGEELQFAKSGDSNVEKAYATHFVNMALKKAVKGAKLQASLKKPIIYCIFCGSTNGQTSDRTNKLVKAIYYCPTCDLNYCDQCSYEKVTSNKAIQKCLKCENDIIKLE